MAAAKDERVQKIAQRAAATTKNKIDDFLVNFAEPRDVDVDIVDASGDVTPDPSQQQSNTAPTQKVTVDVAGREVSPELAKTIDSFTPVVGGKIYKTEGSIGKEDTYGDIGNVPQRVERTYGDLLSAYEKNPKIDASRTRSTLIRQTEKGRDFDIAYKRFRSGIDGPPLNDFDATIAARRVAGIDGGTPGEQTPYRKVLEGLKISSVRRLPTDELVDLAVKRGNQIILPEGVQESNNQVQTLGTKTPSNLILAGSINTADNSLTAQKQRSDIVDNVLDDARQVVQRLPRSGPAEGETQQEFINREFSKSAAEAGDPLPEVSGTTIDASRFPGGTMKERIADLKTANYQALLSGNTTAGMQQAVNATGRKISNGLVYKNNPRLAARDADIITSAQLSGKDFRGEEIYFGPLETKLKQNVKLGAQFPEILQDPTREDVIFQGELRDRTDFEKPVATTASQQRYDDKVQKQLDYREEKIGEAEAQFERRMSAIQDMEGKLKEGQQNVKNIIAGLPERTDLTNRQKQQTAERLGETSRLIRGRLDQQLKAISDAKSDFQSRAKGIMETTQEKIDNIPVEKTIKSQTGELYELRETQNPDTGEVTQNIVPAFSRIEDNETGSSRGSQLRDPGVGQEYLGMLGKIVGEKDKETGRMIYKTSDDPVIDKKGKPVLMFTEEKVRGDKPMANLSGRSMEAQIQDVYSPKYNYDRPTIKRKVAEIQERFKRQQGTRMAGGLTIEDIQDL